MTMLQIKLAITNWLLNRTANIFETLVKRSLRAAELEEAIAKEVTEKAEALSKGFCTEDKAMVKSLGKAGLKADKAIAKAEAAKKRAAAELEATRSRAKVRDAKRVSDHEDEVKKLTDRSSGSEARVAGHKALADSIKKSLLGGVV